MSEAKYSLELRSIGNPFTFDYDFYDEMFRCNFEQKFIDHYYFNEIGFETIERFKHNLKSHLNLNMPYWDQLYRTELAAEDLDFLLNKDLKETFIRTVDTEDKMFGTSNLEGTRASDGTSTDKTTSSNETSSENTSSLNSRTDTSDTTDVNEKRSDIADGVASVSLNQKYLTGVGNTNTTQTGSTDLTNNGTDNTTVTGSGEVNSEGKVTNNENTTSRENNTEDKTGKLLEKTELISQGNIGVTSSAELLEKWRNVLINLDRIIIESCQDLFMGVF